MITSKLRRRNQKKIKKRKTFRILIFTLLILTNKKANSNNLVRIRNKMFKIANVILKIMIMKAKNFRCWTLMKMIRNILRGPMIDL